MLHPLALVLEPQWGERLARPVYKAEFRRREAALRDADTWKLERRQHFEEQGVPSWDALNRGEWAEALRLLEDRREALLATARDDERNRHRFHRARVIEKPLTPYVQWELHSHRQRAEYGERIRVVNSTQVAAAESECPLPEVVVLGDGTLFQVLYTGAGAPIGAIRFTDPALVQSWRTYIRRLYEVGEDVASYFEREVAHLPPPTVRTE